jgi:hypothetical protein
MRRIAEFRILLYGVVGLLMVFGGNAVWAQEPSGVTISVSQQNLAGGQVAYHYKVINGSDQRIVDVMIGRDYYHGISELSVPPLGWSFDTGAPAGSFGSPVGWTPLVITTEESNLVEVEWGSVDTDDIPPGKTVDDGTADIMPGQTVSGFSVIVAAPAAEYMNSHWTVFFGDSSAASEMLLAEGTPRIIAALVSANSPQQNQYSVDLQVTNSGMGSSRNLTISKLLLKTLAGSGTATLASPVLPIAVGDLAAGASTMVTLLLNIPASVDKLSLTEQGSIVGPTGTKLGFSSAQVFYPKKSVPYQGCVFE